MQGCCPAIGGKRLYLIRHAKSSWADCTLEDAQRPLKKRGERDAQLVGEELKKRGVCCQQVLSSKAVRAVATSKIVLEAVGFEGKRKKDKRLYFKGPEQMLACIQERGKVGSDVLFVFGHNPDITELARSLCKLDFAKDIPTTGVIAIYFDCTSWQEISKENGHVEFVLVPKTLRGGKKDEQKKDEA